MTKKSFLARTSTKIYLKTYLGVLTLMFLIPISYMFLIEKSAIMFGANILFFEMNLFLSLVLMIYTYFTRYENKNWKLYIIYFIMSLIYFMGCQKISNSIFHIYNIICIVIGYIVYNLIAKYNKK